MKHKLRSYFKVPHYFLFLQVIISLTFQRIAPKEAVYTDLSFQ